jgi:hypothetical protein
MSDRIEVDFQSDSKLAHRRHPFAAPQHSGPKPSQNLLAKLDVDGNARILEAERFK